MEIKKVKLVYFSPTGTTQRVLKGIAKGIGIGEVESHSLTLPEKATQEIPFASDELIILGAPVYGGRLPAVAVDRLKRLKAKNVMAVLIVLYGNREFEDALLELKNLAAELGFIPVAGGAFIGEHSFATEELPIANGRPDSRDIQTAIEFGTKIKEKVLAFSSQEIMIDLEVPGRFPYESGGAISLEASPVVQKDKCLVCGTCADVCPTSAISINGDVSTDSELCIRCSACIKICPESARIWMDSMMKKIATWLNENCSARKEPCVFGIDM